MPVAHTEWPAIRCGGWKESMQLRPGPLPATKTGNAEADDEAGKLNCYL